MNFQIISTRLKGKLFLRTAILRVHKNSLFLIGAYFYRVFV